MENNVETSKTMRTRVFATLFVSIFASVAGVGIVVPLLPVYAGDLGASGIYISLIFGSFSLSRTFLLPYFGRRSDIDGRKPFIVWGLLCYALISFAFLFFKSVNALIAIRFLQGMASAMILPVAQAYAGDLTPEGREGLSMGLFNMSIFTGLSLGPLMGGFIKDSFSLGATFFFMGGLCAFAFFLALFMLPPKHLEIVTHRNRTPASWKHLLADRMIFGLFALRFAYTTCIGIIWSFLPVYAHDAFSMSSTRIGFLLTLGVFISGLLQMPMGALADRRNKTAMILVGGTIVTYAIASMRWSNGFADIFLANCLFGLGGGICMPAHMALSVKSGKQAMAMGSIMSIMTVAHSLGMMGGSLIAGLITDLSAVYFAFTWGAFFMAAGVIIFALSAAGTKPCP
ncbi:MAG: MFS transporter [Smithellaceae bacterium]